MIEVIQQIKENEVYREILAESYGGIMYDVANKGTYDTSELLPLMESISTESMDGIMKGAYNFIKGD